MERKIGEIFEYNGEWYQCLKSPDVGCKHCDMNFGGKCPIPIKECAASSRSDLYHVIFKKLEKVGEPYINNDRTYQLYKLPMNIEKLPPHTEGINLVRFDIVEIEIRQNKEDMEEKKLNLKPFDLEAAKAGKPVCTRDGRKARIICFDAKGEHPIIALVTDGVQESPYNYTKEGYYHTEGVETMADLMMPPEKKEGWVNVYKERIYSTKEEAIEATYDGVTYVDTVKVCWEE